MKKNENKDVRANHMEDSTSDNSKPLTAVSEAVGTMHKQKTAASPLIYALTGAVVILTATCVFLTMQVLDIQESVDYMESGFSYNFSKHDESIMGLHSKVYRLESNVSSLESRVYN